MDYFTLRKHKQQAFGKIYISSTLTDAT